MSPDALSILLLRFGVLPQRREVGVDGPFNPSLEIPGGGSEVRQSGGAALSILLLRFQCSSGRLAWPATWSAFNPSLEIRGVSLQRVGGPPRVLAFNPSLEIRKRCDCSRGGVTKIFQSFS